MVLIYKTPEMKKINGDLEKFFKNLKKIMVSEHYKSSKFKVQGWS
jgi:hypothetical protein